MSRESFLSFSPPALSEREVEAVAEVVRAGTWLSSGPKTREFEQAFAQRVGAKQALALNSCTAGLHLGLKVHGVGAGDEVITTPMTFCATANVIEHCGATVRLADVDRDTLLIAPLEIEKQISKQTKVIVPVHYAGQPADMPQINAIAKAAKVAVMEDAAHCLPSFVGEEWVGASDNLTTFSFYATKNITTGEGGMMTGASELIDRARVLALHGMSRSAWDRFAKGGNWKYDVPEPGFKYNLTDLASAMGLVQLDRLDELFAARMKVVRIYQNAFRNSRTLRLLTEAPGRRTSHHLAVVLLNLEALTISRDEFITQLTERNIGTSVHYIPIHVMSYYAKKYQWKPSSFPNAFWAYERMLSLPLSSKMTESDAHDVVEAVEEIGRKFAR